MPDDTDRYSIPYALPSDALATVDNTLQALAERVDLLRGETGTVNIGADTADVTKSQRVNYARSYAALGFTPRVSLQVNDDFQTSNVFRAWVSLEDATGFTLNIRASNLVVRPVRWFALGVK